MARSTGAWAIGYFQTCKYRRGQEAVNPEGRGLTVAPFPAGFEYAFSDANYARNRIRHPVALMTTDVLKDQLQPYAAHRRLERRLGIREPKGCRPGSSDSGGDEGFAGGEAGAV